MSIEYKDTPNGAVLVQRDGSHVATLMPQEGGKWGYTIFGTPHIGAKDSQDEVRKFVEANLP